MKRALAIAVLLAARAAAANDFAARGLLSYQTYDYGTMRMQGVRQTYDLRLDHFLTTTSLVRLFVRGDDFNGTTDATGTLQSADSRQIQPAGELLINNDTLLASARSDYFDTRSTYGGVASTRTLQRHSGQLRWRPAGLPELTLLGQRNVTRDDTAGVDLADQNALASLRYTWRDLTVAADQRLASSRDPGAGYDRRTNYRIGNLGYAHTRADGRLTIAADAAAQLANVDERSIGGKSTAIPNPVAIAKATWGVDDTPTDGRDHPLAPLPGLTNGNVNDLTAVSLGPDSASFQNIALDLGLVGRADEVRIVVRDPAGNPLRNGGGPVSWDLYTSEDGVLWTLRSGQTSFNAPLSLYSVVFDLTNTRWLKVVSFGVNSDPTFVTEVQAYYHTGIPAGGRRTGTQNVYNGSALISVQPIKRLTLAYSSAFSAYRQRLGGLPEETTRDLEHLGRIEYGLTHGFAARAEILRRTARSFTGNDNGARGLTMFVDYAPRRELRATLEAGSQQQTVEGTRFRLDTRAVHASAMLLRSVSVTFDAGVQEQTLDVDRTRAQRRFANLTGNVQLAPPLRMLLNASLQRSNDVSDNPAVQVLGPTKDNRVSAELIWRAGRPLTVGARYGWISGESFTGLTQRYHVEWYPFADGTVSLGGSYDQDLDPTLDRRATRMTFTPRWVMNRFVMFDVNYTAVRSTVASSAQQQRTFFATLTLTR